MCVCVFLRSLLGLYLRLLCVSVAGQPTRLSARSAEQADASVKKKKVNISRWGSFLSPDEEDVISTRQISLFALFTFCPRLSFFCSSSFSLRGCPPHPPPAIALASPLRVKTTGMCLKSRHYPLLKAPPHTAHPPHPYTLCWRKRRQM